MTQGLSPTAAPDVRGHRIIVTGGGGLLGREYALALAAAGARVVAADLDRERAEATAAAARGLSGEIAAAAVDVTSAESVGDMVRETRERWGGVDGLVNNAAIDPKFDQAEASTHTASFEQFPLELWNQGLAVNVTGMFLCAQAVAPSMLSQGRGVVVNVSSTYGLVGPDQRLYESGEPGAPVVYKPVTYSVTKAAVIGLTRYLATYWGGKGIRVNTLTPGGVRHQQDAGFQARYGARTPLGRMAEKHEYCGALLFLLSDASSYMTGANLVVDGGWTAW